MARLIHTRVLIFCAAMIIAPSPATAQEVIVLGSLDDVVGWLRTENWWGEEKHGDQLQVPHAIITGISQRWRENAKQMPVVEKKEIFYRFILPLIMHANTMVLDRRARLARMDDSLANGEQLSTENLDWLGEVAIVLRITDDDAAASLGDSTRA